MEYPPDARAAEVLAAMSWLGHAHGGHSADVVVRCLNLYARRPCPWAPVKPLTRKQACATVPARSREAVKVVLGGLVTVGRLATYKGSSNVTLWELVEVQRAEQAAPVAPPAWLAVALEPCD